MINIKTLIVFFLLLGNMLQAQHFGDKNHPMNKETSNMELLSFWNNVTSEDTLLYNVMLKIFSTQKDASYTQLLSNNEYIKLIEKQNKNILGGPILGNVSDKGISIWVRTAKPSKVQIEYTNNNKSFLSKPINSLLEKDLTAVFEISELMPSTRYNYKIIINDSLVVSDSNYFFETIPEKELRIAFGSCPHRWGLGNETLFNTIKSRKPTAMLLLGDIAVQDRNNHIGMHRADYLLRDFQTAWSNFACNVPIYASWDDHDYFGNDKAGIPEGYTHKDKENVWEVFKNSWVNPSYGFGQKDKGIFFKTSIGSCDIIMTDNRYFRTGQKGSFLGKKQMIWLKEQIQNSEGSFLILSCGSMWSDFVSKGKDSWGANDPEGREEILKLIEEKNIAGVLLISGDRHGARGFTIQRDSGFEFYEFEAASLGARIGPPKSKPEWKTQLYGIDDTFAFGEFTFDTTKGKEKVVFRLIHENGDIKYSKTLTLSELIPDNN